MKTQEMLSAEAHYYLQDKAKEDPKIAVALETFEHAHGKQKRDNGEPYFNHPKRVAYAVGQRGQGNRMIISALGHDVIEDCPDYDIREIEDWFGKEVLTDILMLTNIDKIAPRVAALTRPIRKYITAQMLASCPMHIKLIKIEDRWDNVHSPLVKGREGFYRTKYTIETQELMAALWEPDLERDEKYMELVKWEFPK